MPKKNPPITLLLVDDHELVRVGLKSILSEYPGLSVAGEAATAAEAVRMARDLDPAVILLDVRLPDKSGFDVCREVRRFNERVKILMLTTFESEAGVIEAAEAGAQGYLLKGARADELARAVRDAMEGKSILDPNLTGRLFDHIKQEDGDTVRKIESLSPQERRVLGLVAMGLTNKEVAAELRLSEKTVKNYFSSVLSKLGMARRAEAAAFYTRHMDGG